MDKSVNYVEIQAEQVENRNLWRDFLSFPYFTGFLAP